MRMQPDDVINDAVGGASTRRENERDIPALTKFPGLQDELDFFENDLGGKSADRRALHVVWAGANDFLIPSPDPDQTVASAIDRCATEAVRPTSHRVGRFLFPTRSVGRIVGD